MSHVMTHDFELAGPGRRLTISGAMMLRKRFGPNEEENPNCLQRKSFSPFSNLHDESPCGVTNPRLPFSFLFFLFLFSFFLSVWFFYFSGFFSFSGFASFTFLIFISFLRFLWASTIGCRFFFPLSPRFFIQVVFLFENSLLIALSNFWLFCFLFFSLILSMCHVSMEFEAGHIFVISSPCRIFVEKWFSSLLKLSSSRNHHQFNFCRKRKGRRKKLVVEERKQGRIHGRN